MGQANLRMRELTLEGVNRTLREIERQLENLQRRPAFSGDLDMGGNRITNVGRSKNRFDVAPRAELEDKALFENERGQHVAGSTVIAEGFRSVKRAREDNELVPLRQVREMIGTPTGVVTLTNDQAIAGQKSIETLAFPSQAVTCINGNSNHNLLLGDDGRTLLRIIGPTAAFGISGFADSASLGPAVVDGRFLIVLNLTGFPMTILHPINGLSSAQYRINPLTTGSANYTTAGSGAVMLVYATATAQWNMISKVD